jgi:hypothetical protein
MAPTLTVAVTGPTGTFGFGLMPLLEADPRIGRVVGIARRPFDPVVHGWTKMSYRRGDVRDHMALAGAFAGADVVVHLAFTITGTAALATIREINVEGTLNAIRAAAATHAGLDVYLLRPPIVLGPNAAGAKDLLTGPLVPLGRRLVSGLRRLPLPLPARRWPNGPKPPAAR